MLVDGELVPARSGEALPVIDPGTGRPVGSVPRGGSADVDAAVGAARRAFDDRRWTKLRPSKRTEVLLSVASLLRENMDELAELESLDTGKPLRQASAEVWFAADAFRYYAGWPTKIYGDTIPATDDLLVYTLRQPVGVCAAITAWNFPLLLAAFKVPAALAFGNSVVVKPSEHASLSTLRLGELCLEAGVPPGIVNVVSGTGPEAGAPLVGHPGVDKIAFTGSTDVGRAIARQAADSLSNVSLELGGKSPNIVLCDADLERAAAAAFHGVFLNSGQMCAAGTRILVEDSIHDDFVDALVARARAARVGRGLDPASELGPLITERQYDRVKSYVAAGESEGARLVTGGGRPAGLDGGWFVEPTIFVDVDNDMQIARDEIFGPVASVLRFSDLDEAVRLANDTRYGLGAAVWTSDLTTAHRVARDLRSGTVWINTYGLVDPAVPFGGMKESGFGRELGRESADLFTETKAVWVGLGHRGTP